MATPRKKPVNKKTAVKKVSTVRENDLTPLDVHAIQLHELYKAYRRAGFDTGTVITLITTPDSYPEWFMSVPDLDILEEEEEGD